MCLRSTILILTFIRTLQLERKEVLDRIPEGSVLPSVLLSVLSASMTEWKTCLLNWQDGLYGCWDDRTGIQNGLKPEKLILNSWMRSNKVNTQTYEEHKCRLVSNWSVLYKGLKDRNEHNQSYSCKTQRQLCKKGVIILSSIPVKFQSNIVSSFCHCSLKEVWFHRSQSRV